MYRDYNESSANFGESDSYGRSKINAAGLINLTLEGLWKEVFKFQGKNDLWKWNRHLDSIWCILGGDETEGSENARDFKAIELQIGKTGSLVHKSTGFNAISGDSIKTMAVQYQLLMKKALFLRRLQNKQGKGTAYVDEFEDEVE
jgi:hypothetical protein